MAFAPLPSGISTSRNPTKETKVIRCALWAGGSGSNSTHRLNILFGSELLQQCCLHGCLYAHVMLGEEEDEGLLRLSPDGNGNKFKITDPGKGNSRKYVTIPIPDSLKRRVFPGSLKTKIVPHQLTDNEVFIRLYDPNHIEQRLLFEDCKL